MWCFLAPTGLPYYYTAKNPSAKDYSYLYIQSNDSYVLEFGHMMTPGLITAVRG
jgi:hypothetical protein